MKIKSAIMLIGLALLLTAFAVSCSHKDHSFGKWETVSAASCTEDGLEKRVCECGEEEARVIEKLEHTYTARDEVTDPTCTEQGYTTHFCACGESITDSYTSKISHSYGEWTVTTAATCTDKGEEQRKCECGDTEVREIEATGIHEYTAKSEVTDPTCTERGYTIHFCACGESITDSYTSKVAHSYGEWVTLKEATVIQKKQEKRTCIALGCTAYETKTGSFVTYVKANKLMTFTNGYYAAASNPYRQDFRYGQGGCCNGRYFYQAFVNINDDLGVIARVDMESGEIAYSTPAKDLGHANDVTYNSKTNEIIVIRSTTKMAVIYDATTLEYKRNQELPVTATAISYNAHNDTYVMFNIQANFYIVESDFTTITGWSGGGFVAPTGYVAQGICSDENYIYSLFYKDVDGDVSTLDYKACVRVKDYNFNTVNTFEIELGQANHEAESISIVDGKFYVGAAALFALPGGVRPYADFTVYEFTP